MIIVFHSLYFLVKHLVNMYKTTKAINFFQSCQLIGNEVKIHTNCIITDSLDLRFDPPLYKQRYVTVQQILLNVNWKSRIKKIVEFGCAELNLFTYLKHLSNIKEIIFVDIDDDVLNDNLFKVHPLTVDYIKRRPTELKVRVLAGSICKPDPRLIGCDAVVAIELIEHLYPDTLEAIPYNIFHYIKPLLVLFTTPNYEFNSLFPDTKKFRHFDHKFEWTREQFQSWALNITTRFPNYAVQFDGIGPGPRGTEYLGCCTQVAIFLRHPEDHEQLSEVPRSCREIVEEAISNVEVSNESHGICTYYSYVKQIQEFTNGGRHDPNCQYREIEYIEYPFHIDNRTPEEIMLHEVKYKIYSAENLYSRFYNEEKDRVEYPLHELVANEDGCFTTVIELSELLQKENFTVEECIPFNSNERSLCVVCDLSMENHSSSPSNNGNNSDDNNTYKLPWNVTSEDSDWETEYNQCVKINDNTIEHEQETKEDKANDSANKNNQKVTYQFHSSLATTSASREKKEDVKKEGTASKRQTNSHSKLSGPSTMHNTDKIPKKGTNIKNRDTHISAQGSSKEHDLRKRKNDNMSNNDVNEKKSFKKNIEMKIHDSTHSQNSTVQKSNRTAKSTLPSNPKFTPKGKIMTSSSLKRLPIKSDDSSLPGTSDLKKKKKGKKSDEDKEDIKALTECIIYNTLNNIPEIDETGEEPCSSCVSNKTYSNNINITEIDNSKVPNVEVPVINNIGHEIIDVILSNSNFEIDCNKNLPNVVNDSTIKDPIVEPINQELNHASREALFDPNSETDMLEEFEIPPAPPMPAALEIPIVNQHHNVILIGLNVNNEEESVVLPDNADPFPNWLLQLLGANVEEGESHDEPHFYCQGDGIGVHPSIIEVEIDEEESTSESSSSHDEAEAERTLSDSGVVPLPSDGDDDDSTIADVSSVPLSMVTPPGSTSAADSTDEFFDSIEENLSITDRQNSEFNKKK